MKPPSTALTLETNSISEGLPESARHRNEHIAQLCSQIVPKGIQVVVPQKQITTEELHSHLKQHGFARTSTWVYGSQLPEALIERSSKIQVHPIINADYAPDWFDTHFPECITETTPPGFSCFSLDDLRDAVGRILAIYQSARLKAPTATSGEDQIVVRSLAELEKILLNKANIHASEDVSFEEYVASHGYVVESNLENVKAWSATVTTLPSGTYASFGQQIELMVQQPDGSHTQIYGGTSSVTVRGDLQALLQLPAEGVLINDPVLSQTIELRPNPAIIHAAQQHIAGMQRWEADGIYRTRANVDILTGDLVFRNGERRAVTVSVEDSGRAGGASPAELLGIKDLQTKPNLRYATRSSRHSFDPTQAKVYAEHTRNTPEGQVFWHEYDSFWQSTVFMGVF
jgi:hypothetical protein